MSSSLLSISLFGDFNLTYDERSVKGLSNKQFQSLLAYLLLHRDAPQPRQKLAFLYWSDISDGEGLTNLRRRLYRLRKVLPDAESFIETNSKTVRWLPDAPLWLDVAEFEKEIALAEVAAQNKDLKAQITALTTASDLYRGELLVSCDDDWLVSERQKWQQIAIANIEKLIQVLARQRDYNAAIIQAKKLLNLDPYYEKGYQILIKLQQNRGDRAGALQTYHQCLNLFREELGVDPNAETRSLYQGLLDEDNTTPDKEKTANSTDIPPTNIPSSITVAPQFSIVGRQQEWQRIFDWQNSTLEKTPLLLITGESGIGKTRLLEEVVATAKDNLILWGTGFEAERLRPYGAWSDALRTIPSEVAGNLPSELSPLLLEVAGNAEPLEDPSLLYDAVVNFLGGLAVNQPIIIFDDLQWLDEASISLLHYAMRSLYRSPIKFICTARSHELSLNQPGTQFVRALRRDKRIDSISLKPLNSLEIDELVTTFITRSNLDLKSQSGEHRQRIYQDSGGNPLFALETARALIAGETDNLGDLSSLICDRLNRLTEPARELLPWAAALGHSFEPTLLADVADCSLAQLLTAVEELEQQGIIRPNLQDRDRYDFVHEVVRRVAYDLLSAPRRKLVHLQIAQKLQQKVNTNPTITREISSDLAYHAAKGGDDLLAATSSLQAARKCLSLFAYNEAAQLSKQGIEHCKQLDPRTRANLSLQLLQVRAQTGMTNEQIALLETEIDLAISEARSLGLVEAETFGLEALIKLNFVQNRFTAMQTNSLRVSEVGEFTTPETSAKILAHSGGCMAGMGRDMEKAEAILLEAQSLANRSGLKLGNIAFGLGCVARFRGELDNARTYLKQSITLDRIAQNHWDEWVGLAELVMVELEANNLETALKHCQNLMAIATKLEGGSEPTFSEALKILAYYAREPTATIEKLNTAIANLQELDAQRKLAYILSYAAEIDFKCGNLSQGVAKAEDALEAARIVDHPSDIALARGILIQGQWMMGNVEESISQLDNLQEYASSLSICDRAEQKIIYLRQQLKDKVLVN